MSAYHWRDLIFTRGGQSELLTAHEVVEHFFETLGTPASLGRTVLAFVCAIIVLTSLFFSLVPLLRVSGSQPYEALKTEGRGFSAGAAKRRLAQTFVVSEFVFSLVLLILVLVQSFLKLQRTDAGFNAKNLLTLHIQVPAASYEQFVAPAAPENGVYRTGQTSRYL